MLFWNLGSPNQTNRADFPIVQKLTLYDVLLHLRLPIIVL